jgi:hypothetical protein
MKDFSYIWSNNTRSNKMSLSKCFTLVACLTLFVLTSCKDGPQQTQIEEQSATAVPHYICANNCENSNSSTAGVCKTCNEPLSHNEAFHAQDFLKNGPLNVPKYESGRNQSTTNQTPTPAQNSQGIFHYTCPNGCTGGAGSAGKCNVCGNDLEHNQAYHN